VKAGPSVARILAHAGIVWEFSSGQPREPMPGVRRRGPDSPRWPEEPGSHHVGAAPRKIACADHEEEPEALAAPRRGTRGKVHQGQLRPDAAETAHAVDEGSAPLAAGEVEQRADGVGRNGHEEEPPQGETPACDRGDGGAGEPGQSTRRIGLEIATTVPPPISTARRQMLRGALSMETASRWEIGQDAMTCPYRLSVRRCCRTSELQSLPFSPRRVTPN